MSDPTNRQVIGEAIEPAEHESVEETKPANTSVTLVGTAIIVILIIATCLAVVLTFAN